MEELQKENEELKNRVQELEERLKKYTNGDNHKRYYEKNKDKIKEQGTTYLKKLKEYVHFEPNCNNDPGSNNRLQCQTIYCTV